MSQDWVILGCGYVGSRLARALRADGHRVRACARRLERLEGLAALGVSLHAFDAAKLRSFGPALYGAQSPIVLYSVPSVPGVPAGEPVRRAAEAAMAVGARRFIYLGSTAVYGATPHGETVDEDSPVAISDPDAAARLADEGAVQLAGLGGLSTVVLRLAAIYGPGRGVRERLRAGSYRLIDDGRYFFSRVHVDDIVGVVRAAADRAPSGAVYCVADERPTTQREYADWLTERMGTAPPPSVPSLAPGAPRRAVRNRRVSSARLRQELGYAFLYPSYLEGERAIEAEREPEAAMAERQARADTPPEASAKPQGRGEERDPVVEAAPSTGVIDRVWALWCEALSLELERAAGQLDADQILAAGTSIGRGLALLAQLAAMDRSFAGSAHPDEPSSSPSPAVLEPQAVALAAAWRRALQRIGTSPEQLGRDAGQAPALAELDEGLRQVEVVRQGLRGPPWLQWLAWGERD